MRIRPLTGQALIVLLPRDEKIGEIFIPETSGNAPGDLYAKRTPRKGIVKAIGPWKKTKSGHAVLPDFKKGDTVILNDYTGTRLSQDVRDHLRLIKIEDVIGILTPA